MYEVNCINLVNNQRFTKYFYDYLAMQKFIRKCKYSKKIKITGVFNWIYKMVMLIFN